MTGTERNTVILTLQGAPVIEPHGIDNSFFGKMLPAFCKLAECLCTSPDEEGEAQPLPMLLYRMNISSSLLRVQEEDSHTPRGLTAFHTVIEFLLENNEEEIVEMVNGITDESFNTLKKFLGLNSSGDTTFTVVTAGQTTQMDDLEQLRNILKMLRNLRKTELVEEGVEVIFTGYLPDQKRAEFTREEHPGIQAARVNPKATGLEDIIQRIGETRKISIMTRQTGGGNPARTILAVE